MSYNKKKNSDNSDHSTKIEFKITENLLKLGIKEFTLQDRDFLITWSNGRNSCINFNFNSTSISQIIKLNERTLRKEVKGKNIDAQILEDGISDIEDQLIKRREEIFNLNKTKTPNNEFESEFIEEVFNIKTNFEKSSNPFGDWQLEVGKKYAKLQEIIIKHYPEAWPIMEFCLAVKSVQNIQDNTLPFIGIILAKPSSLKTTIIELFRKYPGSFYSDSFTPNSMISHNSALSEEKLQKVDMLPKMNSKFVLTPELAPLFTAKDDDLQKVLGIVTRIVDGKGYESDSGAQGHRKYSNIMFTWVGAAVEILAKVWKLLSQLGFKIYFFRPNLEEKSVNDLTNIIKDNDYVLKNKEIEKALLDYLKVFDAAPNTEYSSIDENNIVKIKWNLDTIGENDCLKKEQVKALEYIAQIAKLLAPLRGIVYVSQSKLRKYQKSPNNNSEAEVSFQTEELDYDTDSPIIEDPSRAAVVLRNLAISNAFSQGRNYLTNEDVTLIIQVAFSTTRIHRSKLLKLLLRNNGELTTSQIVNQLGMSEPFARKTMREFEALGISKTSSISPSINSELKIRLNDKFSWFLTEEFQKLGDLSIQSNRHSAVSRESICYSNNMSYQSIILRNHLSNNNFNSRPFDNRHTLKQNLPLREINNKDIDEFTITSPETKINFDGSRIIEEKVDNNNSKEENLQENNVSLYLETFQHVTPSQENHLEKEENCTIKKQLVPEDVIEDVLKVIRDGNGSISLGFALQLACQKSEIVKEYFKDEKLTQRDSRKVKNLFVEINRHMKIKEVKRKPELVVRWIEQEEVIINN
jgi:hypothetical protein